MTGSPSTPAPVVRGALWDAVLAALGPSGSPAQADAVLSGPIAAMQAEHQRTVEALTKALSKRLMQVDHDGSLSLVECENCAALTQALEPFARHPHIPFGQKFTRVSVADIERARASLEAQLSSKETNDVASRRALDENGRHG